MNLFFDDVRNPPKEGEWLVARNVNEATRLLRSVDFDIVSLDHDIEYALPSEDAGAPKIMQPVTSPGPNGMALAQWMVRNLNGHEWPRLILCHSGRPEARNTMYQYLTDNVPQGVVVVCADWTPDSMVVKFK